MATSDSSGLEFLDLTDVDEYEKNRLLTSLQPLQTNQKFPWFIGDSQGLKTTHTKRQPITIVNPENGLIVPLNPKPEPVSIQPFYNPLPQYYPVVTAIPTGPVHIPPQSYPETYPAYTYPVKQPVYYGVPPAQPLFVSHTSTSYYPNNDYMVEQSVDLKPLSADVPEFTPKNLQPVIIEPPEPEEEITTEQEVAPKSVWGAKKSWASLFTPKDSPELNGIKIFPQIKESNNNECPIKNPKKNQFIDPDCYRMGEFLLNYLVDGRTISLQPRGLINQSNYCYINSILQALIACPPVYNLLSGLAENITSNAKRKPTPVIDGMCKFVKEYKHLPANMRVSNRRSEGNKKDQKKDQGVMINTDIPFEPAWIYKILHNLQTDLMEGRQEDAEEFLGCLLNNLSDEMLELMKLVDTSEKTTNQTEEDEESWQVMGNKNKGSVLRKTQFEKTPITDIFGGSLKSKINRIGGLSTENTQPFLTLPLNIEKVKTVCEALEALTGKYQLEGLTSSKTNEEIEAWQQVMLDELPVILVLHLKCFDFKLDGCTKIVKALEFPIDLKIDAKLLSSKTTSAKEKQYKLFAIVYHEGKEATKGHYVTDAFHVGYSSWLRYDDASVKPVLEEDVLNPQGTRVPYLLFYRRSDTIRSR
ncbi:unnamed protein product [Ceutorhynchus assimilis]|uniref:ubiquitinyl hydrolase 1 n=1 Tax=Ceutorhynchus assimilis TaxID=467358 RepID=A0A9N9Q9T0_9CUCU|nr:unnamed protein product [Ceutorhynchus assimilis]